MSNKGTLRERIICLSIGFLVYGLAYIGLYSLFNGDALSPGLLGIIWLFSVLSGLLGSLFSAIAVLELRDRK